MAKQYSMFPSVRFGISVSAGIGAIDVVVIAVIIVVVNAVVASPFDALRFDDNVIIADAVATTTRSPHAAGAPTSSDLTFASSCDCVKMFA